MTGSHSGIPPNVPRRAVPTGTGHNRTARPGVPAPASWVLGIVAVLLIGVLTYYLTLTTRPEISEISPAPNSAQIPGVVELEARINSQRSVEDAVFFIDGEEVTPILTEEADGYWRVHYEQVFERGQREVVLKVTDSSGRTAEHSWSFLASGDLIPPRLMLLSPSSHVRVAPGLNGVVLQSTTFAEIEDIVVTFNGEQIDTELEEVGEGTEYSNQDDLPIFDWHILASEELTSGFVQVEATITDVFGASTSDEWTIRVAPGEATANARFFEETGQYIIEPFLEFWDENAGDVSIGPPISPTLTEEDGREIQYFRYARLELDDDGDVHRGLIGREMFGEPESPPDRTPGSDARLFDATGHYIQGTIREFWEENGGLGAFGYPVSQQFSIDNGYAQYFERALIEVSEFGSFEFVELAPLGEKLYETYLMESSEPGPTYDAP